jgi:hypothetical protein
MKELSAEEQEILLKGSAAEALLSNDAMVSVINELNAKIIDALLSTAVAEPEKRERFYYLHTALKELVAILKERANQKAALEVQLAEDDATENE